MEFDTRLRRSISGKKIKPVSDSGVCYRTFQSPTNRDVPRTEKRVTHNQIGNVPTKRLVYHNSATRCNGPRAGKNHWKDHAPIASQPFCPSSSSAFSAWIGDSVADPFDFFLASRYVQRHSRSAVKYFGRISTRQDE